jgi:pilin isopeptide linkage protein/uncharacterized repeat protein (TIGR02543 family)
MLIGMPRPLWNERVKKIMRRKLYTIITVFLLVIGIIPFGAIAQEATTYRITVNYIDSITGDPVSEPYEAVLAPGDTYSADSPEIEGYTLEDPTQSTVSGTADADETITVKYLPGEGTYIVSHYFENIDGAYIKDETATQTLTADRNSTVSVTPLTRDGYVCVTDDLSVSIPTDGSIVEKDLYYDRTDNQAIIYFSTGGSYVPYISAAAGTDISAEIEERTSGSLTPTKQGYIFDKWETDDADYNAQPGIMPDHNITLTAKWNPGTANYRVIYWCEHTYEHGEYYIGAVDTRTGTVGTEASFDRIDEDAAAALLEFEKADDNVIIKADGSSIVNVYYKIMTIHVIVYKRDWNYNSDDQIIYSEQDVRVGDPIELPSDDYMKKYFDDDQLHGTDPDTLDGLWGDSITMRWTYYNPNVSGTYIGDHMRYFSELPARVYPRGVDKTTYTMKVYPDFRYKRSYPYFDSFHLYNPNTGEYEMYVRYMNYSTLDGTGDEKKRIRPSTYKGYTVKYVRYSTETYFKDSGDEPALGDFVEIATDDNGNVPEGQWFYQVYDPTNYIAFYYQPNEYALNYIVNGETVYSENLPYTLEKTLDYVPEVPADLAANGYTFDGWYQEGDTEQTIVDSTVINYNENNFVAKFKAPQYTVTFDLNGGTMQEENSQTVNRGALASAPDPAPVRDGYTFTGWYYKESGALYEFDMPVNTDIDLIAGWEPASAAVRCTVKHQLQDGTILKAESFDVDSRTKYVFAKSLDEDDDAYPSNPVIPDAFCKSLLLSQDPDDNVIVFTYYEFPSYNYLVKYLDRATGSSISEEYVFSDIAQIMTIISKEISGYAAEQVYGRGSAENTEISLYYTRLSIIADSPQVIKKIEGDKPNNNASFSFVMEAVPSLSTLPDNMNSMPMPGGNAEQSVALSIIGSGSGGFGDFTFNEPGTYVYRVRELDSAEAGYKYDDSEYLLIYNVEENNGELTCERTIRKNGTEVDGGELVFVNKYEFGGSESGTAVNTGDGSGLEGYFILLASASAAAVLVAFITKRGKIVNK